ncbi:PIN/TRAM domain-containing protein [Enterococcus gallinarum]|uniref:PIN/TRAM domain-containing protein n=1 Tax=Enterococcus gallinarum TaxID=1353 RepID=UPI001AD6A814|nr:PIN/TRAM domain-containing protein [Enterococcus gallinarum]MBO6331350.1 PIN/TRAM domain-containing protein [Enterococcus gallinarum]MBO6352587.1 PIN/TRAM domain-containing protein [Enterococcus gallinarum]MBO6394512.1 PIN/TRAM domain-containing protein [Enterococcus gallinarum]MBO6423660.1 PIN/TRAM domain-containing protein [Enterococcus gallinarum]
MQKRVITALMVLAGASLGISLMPVAWQTIGQSKNEWLNNNITNSLLGALIFFLLSLLLAKYIAAGIRKIEEKLSELSLTYLLFGAIGSIIGLMIGVIVSIPFYNWDIPFINGIAPILVMALLGYLGFQIGTTRIEEWKKIFSSKSKKTEPVEEQQMLDRKIADHFHKYKILDTSVIIDGRIYDVAKTGFLEGVLLIPNFVLYELQYIADSGDSLKRVRGRRGLDILNALQKEEGIAVEMYEGDFDDISEVDSKLIKLAKILDGTVVTNDYNLNKVSEFQNVPVLNINALANAVKPVVIPGETMNVLVVKAGTERQQGVAYLDDGTMVVVEDGQHYMNEHIQVVVTSALQTAAGRMIFAKPAHSSRGIDNQDDTKN